MFLANIRDENNLSLTTFSENLDVFALDGCDDGRLHFHDFMNVLTRNIINNTKSLHTKLKLDHCQQGCSVYC